MVVSASRGSKTNKPRGECLLARYVYLDGGHRNLRLASFAASIVLVTVPTPPDHGRNGRALKFHPIALIAFPREHVAAERNFLSRKLAFGAQGRATQRRGVCARELRRIDTYRPNLACRQGVNVKQRLFFSAREICINVTVGFGSSFFFSVGHVPNGFDATPFRFSFE